MGYVLCLAVEGIHTGRLKLREHLLSWGCVAAAAALEDWIELDPKKVTIMTSK